MARDRLAEAIAAVMQPRLALADAAGPGEQEFRTGHCSLARVPEGVVLRIDEGPDDFEGLLRSIAHELDERGVEGQLSLYESEDIAQPPERIDFFECHLRLDGERVPRVIGGRNCGALWKPDPAAIEAVTEIGIDWCRENAPELPLSLVVGLLPPATFAAGDDVRPYFEDGIKATGTIGALHLTSSAPDRFRTFALKPGAGRVALLEGGPVVAEDWRSCVSRMTGAMRRFAPMAVYAYLKRGSLRLSAIYGGSLEADWVEVPHMEALRRLHEDYEDEFVPDAFGAQLLSAGHQQGFPERGDWRVERLGSARVLVEHVEPALWFDGSLVPFGGRPREQPPAPSFVVQAREEFVPILFRDEIALAWQEDDRA